MQFQSHLVTMGNFLMVEKIILNKCYYQRLNILQTPSKHIWKITTACLGFGFGLDLFAHQMYLLLFATLAKQCTNNHPSDHFQVVKSDAQKQTMIDKGKEMLANAQV